MASRNHHDMPGITPVDNIKAKASSQRETKSISALRAVAIAQLLGGLGVLSVSSVTASGVLLLGESAGTADSLVLDVVEGAEQFTVRTVHVRLVAGDADTVEDVGGLVEDAVHLLQRTQGGLGEEEVDGGDDGGVTVRY